MPGVIDVVYDVGSRIASIHSCYFIVNNEVQFRHNQNVIHSKECSKYLKLEMAKRFFT